MFKIKLTSKATRQLKNLSKEQRISVGEILEDIKDNPLIGKPLERELTGKFSYRTGIYRILYKINQQDEVVTVLSALHRGVAYN